MLVFSIFCDFSLIHEVFINIRTLGSQFDNYILLHCYIALQKQSFDTYFCFLGLSVAKIHACFLNGLNVCFQVWLHIPISRYKEPQ